MHLEVKIITLALLWMLLISVGIIVISFILVKKYKGLSNVIGMMVAMAFAMCSGLLFGLTASFMPFFHFMAATVVGMMIGMGIGTLFGRLFHIGAVLEGVLAGVMGGMMGAMTGEMLDPVYYDSMIKLMLMVQLVVFLLLMAVFKEELHIHFPPLIHFFLFHPIGLLVLFLLFFASTEWTGPIIEQSHVPPPHHSINK